MNVRNVAPLDTDQVQPALAVTAIELVPPRDVKLALVGAIEYVQGAVPSWVIVKVEPATVIVPVRETVVALAATVYPTVPFAVPGVPELTVTNPSLLTAVQEHPVPAVTEIFPGPPAAT